MKALHISNKPVYPLVDGGCVAMSKILQSLQQVSETAEHLFIHTHKHPVVPGAYPEMLLPLPAGQSFIDTSIRPLSALKALISGKNYNLQRFYSQSFEQDLIKYVQAAGFDVIVLESLFLAAYIPALRTVTKARLVIRAHNVEHELWEQQAAHASFPKKFYLRSLAKSLKREEIELLNTADLIWAITGEDALRFRELGIKTPVATIPVAMETTERRTDYSSTDFFHLGSLNWSPNLLAVEELTGTLWPKLGLPESNLHIAGSFAESYPGNDTKNVRFHGYVKNPAAFMQEHGTLVTPVRTGSGVRIKLLEALSLGVPCITTPLGATGITDPESVLLVADSEQEWLDAMREIAGSETIRREFGEKAQRYIDKYHSFAAVNAQLLASLEH